MKALFIINPVAGRGAALKVWRRIEHLVTGDRQIDAVIPDSAAGTRKAAAEARKAGYERAIVVGGDGTLLAVADELAHGETALGVIPAGTGNDFCRNSDIVRQAEAALRVALGPHTRRIDLGQAAGGRHFLNAAGIGFDAEVAAAASSFPTGLGGNLPYLLGALQTLFRYKPIHVEITVDDQKYTGPITMVAVANGRYYGGGMQIAPLASRSDGLLDVYVAEGLSRGQVLGLLPRVYTGGHIHNPKVHLLRGQQVRVQVSEPVRAHIDGEPLFYDALAFHVHPRALAVALPEPDPVEAERPASAAKLG